MMKKSTTENWEEVPSENGVVEDQRNVRIIEKKYRTLLEGIREAYFEVDFSGTFIFFNDALPMILGDSREELMGVNGSKYMRPEALADMKTFFTTIYKTGEPARKSGIEVLKRDGSRSYHELFVSLLKDETGNPIGFMGIAHDITERTLAEIERENLIKNLRDALDQVKTLSGLLPICATCKKIRDDKGYWKRIESYIQDHSDVELSHSICPECAGKYYPELNIYDG